MAQTLVAQQYTLSSRDVQAVAFWPEQASSRSESAVASSAPRC
jgi:hypothetical protein